MTFQSTHPTWGATKCLEPWTDNEDISTTYNLDVHVFKYREVIGNIYQKNKMIIGENLILTMDDYNENISSSIIIKIIERDILPALNGVRVSKELISAANVQRPRR